MQILKISTAVNNYEIDDTVLIVDDGHQWSTDDLANYVMLETSVALSGAEISKLKMSDDGPVNYAAISRIATFRSALTRQEAMKQLHRKKYFYSDNAVKLKVNSQERN